MLTAFTSPKCSGNSPVQSVSRLCADYPPVSHDTYWIENRVRHACALLCSDELDNQSDTANDAPSDVRLGFLIHTQ